MPPPPPPGHACATPNGNWDVARTATVEVGNNPPTPNDFHNNVDIIQIRWTAAMVAITRIDYPNGVVILNDNPRPADANPIYTHDHPRVHLTLSSNASEPIDLIRNAGWPTVVIVIWLPLQP